MSTSSGKSASWQRRKFISTVAAAAGASALTLLPATGFAKNFGNTMTIRQVMDLMLKSIPGAPFKTTVDTIKAGDADQQVTGIVTTMFATVDVIRRAAELGANFIIAHEPSFYNHLDETAWLENDEVFKYKKALLQQHNIVIWRFHDYIHAHQPDGVLMGVLNALGWQQYYDAQKPYLVTIAPATLGAITDLAKTKLGIPHVKLIGDKKQLCTRIALIPGAAGGRTQITALQKEKPDLLICGELNEWETSEYIRDQRSMGGSTSLLVLGHIVSEEPGLEWLVQWLQPQVPGIKVTHVPSTDAFRWA
jgi:putative NIF3 family GTP cyclohydrolase 1 type 2